MVTRRSKELELEVARLDEILRQRRDLERQEKEIKDRLRDAMGAENVMKVGSFLVLLTLRKRRDLDKEKVKGFLGAYYSECERETEYSILEVKRA